MFQPQCIVIYAIISGALSIDYDGWLNMKLEHTLNCGEAEFCPRGTLSVKSIRAGTADINQILFTEKHIEELRLLAEEDGFYTVRTWVTSAEYKDVEYMSSVKAQAFLDSGLSDEIHVWVLPNGGVISVEFQINNITEPLKKNKDQGYYVYSNFNLNHVEQAPVPDTASYIQKLEREREAREKGELKDNRSFLAKYWMYIVPVAIFVLISGATNPEQAQGQRQ